MAARKRSTRVVDIPAVSSVEEKDKTESESEEEGSTPPIPPISTSSVSQGSENIHSPTASASKRLADPQENGYPKKTKVFESVTVKDEIAMLKGMIDYVANKGEDPFADLAGFHDFIKESSSVVDVSNDQLTDKIKSLKNKYQNNVELLQTQPETVLARPHEKTLFHLSKEIWGKADSPVSQQQNGSGSGFMTHLEIPTSLEISDDAMKILNKNIGLLGDAKTKELEEKEMDLNVAVLELYSKRLALIRERTSMVIDAMKASMS